MDRGHRVRWAGKAIDQPGTIPIPSSESFVELSGELYLDTFDRPFPDTMTLKRSECGYLLTHLCHHSADGTIDCPNITGTHAVVSK